MYPPLATHAPMKNSPIHTQHTTKTQLLVNLERYLNLSFIHMTTPYTPAQRLRTTFYESISTTQCTHAAPIHKHTYT